MLGRWHACNVIMFRDKRRQILCEVEKANVREYKSEAWGLKILIKEGDVRESFWGLKTTEKSIAHIMLERETVEEVSESRGCLHMQHKST